MTPDGAVPRIPALPADAQETAQWMARGNWFAILDACDEPVVPVWAVERGARAACLYDEPAADDYWDTAPYVFHLDAGLYEKIRLQLLRRPWGWFFEADIDLETARRHWKRFVRARDEHGSEFFFRFYDPRVLRTFMAHADLAEQEAFMGPVRSLLALGEKDHATLWIGMPSASDARRPFLLRDAVMTAFGAAQMQRFKAEVAAALRNQFPDLLVPWSDADLAVFIERGIQRCRAWGFVSEDHVLRCLRLMLLHERLDRDPLPEAMEQIVRKRDLSAKARLQELESQLRIATER